MSTSSRRSTTLAFDGSRKGTPAATIFAFARAIRFLIVSSGTRNAVVRVPVGEPVSLRDQEHVFHRGLLGCQSVTYGSRRMGTPQSGQSPQVTRPRHFGGQHHAEHTRLPRPALPPLHQRHRPSLAAIRIRRVRAEAQYEDLPIIIISTEGANSDKMRGFEAGANLYIVKPSEPAVMIENIRLVLAGH